MAEGTERAITFERTAVGEYLVTNARGGTLTVGTGDADFTAVELLLTAIATCSAVDVDLVTSRRAEPAQFSGRVRGDKIRDEHGNRMENVELVFTITFPRAIREMRRGPYCPAPCRCRTIGCAP